MSDARGKNCDELRELISAYRDNELASSERQTVEEHLNSCSQCRQELASIESVASRLAALPAVSLDRDMSQDIESLILRSQKASDAKVVEMRPSRAKVMWLSVAAAALALLLAVGGYIATTGGGAPTIAAKSPQQTEQNSVDINAPAKVAQTNDRSEDKSAAPEETQPQNTVKVAETPATPVKQQQKEQVMQPLKVAVKPVEVVAPKEEFKQKNTMRVVTPRSLADLDDNEVMLALTPADDDNNEFDNMGISTDEDGFYAIKM